MLTSDIHLQPMVNYKDMLTLGRPVYICKHIDVESIAVYNYCNVVRSMEAG
jgi:hypothetical protein